MPYEEHNQRGQEYSYAKHTCDGDVTSDLKTTGYDKITQITSNDKQRRPKPANLLANPTALNRQSIRITDAGEDGWKFIHPKSCRHAGESQYNRTLVKDNKWRPNTPFLPFEDPLTGDWQTGIRQQINSLQVNLGQDLAEYRQSANMFSSAARGAVNAWHAYKGRRKRRSITPCAIPAADLIYGFGVAPLVNTVFDSVLRLQSTLDNPTLVKVIQSAVRTESYDQLINGQRWVGKQRRTSRAEAYVSFDRNSRSFTLGNPASIAWELVPYSFLFDYMIPVGGYLSSLDAMVGTRGVSGTLSHKDKCSGSITRVEFPEGATSTYSKPCKCKLTQHEREVITSIPFPPFPRWKPSASWHKLRHAVALLYQTNQC